MKKSKVMTSTLASLLASTAVQLTSTKAASGPAAPSGGSGSAKVHCKGVAIKYVNDCSATDQKGYSHSCGGKAKINFDPNEWLKMKEEDCKAVQTALKKAAMKNYVKKMQKSIAKNPNQNFDPNNCFTINKKDCKAVQASLANPVVKDYAKLIQQGTVGAVRRGKK